MPVYHRKLLNLLLLSTEKSIHGNYDLNGRSKMDQLLV